jgi:hypothetical protein
MKKLLFATSTAIMLLGVVTPTFAEQSLEGMNIREMRIAEYFKMKKMVSTNMAHLKSQQEALKHFDSMLQKMIDCENKNLRDGQHNC